MILRTQPDRVDLHSPVAVEQCSKLRVSLVQVFLSTPAFGKRHTSELVLANDFVKLYQEVLV
jgi:hypothetical protein